MFLGRVIGNVQATRKDDRLGGVKLLIVQPAPLEDKDTHLPVVAADRIGAGIGEDVIVAFGRAARLAMGDENLPIEAAILAIVDGTEVRSDAKLKRGLGNEKER
ncbi:MAG: EutN/CcmL family microcompartment protein [Planctomycetes bacterium]|nr:EutN/CcmL family microcompartment protein [Planctomycetota bacterium]